MIRAPHRIHRATVSLALHLHRGAHHLEGWGANAQASDRRGCDERRSKQRGLEGRGFSLAVRILRLEGALAPEATFSDRARIFLRRLAVLAPSFAILAALLATAPARAGEITLPPEAVQAMDKMYGGDPDAAIAIMRDLEKSQPENPLPFLLEGEARWWKIYCRNLELRYGMIDAWRRGKKPEDEDFLLLADKVINLARAQISRSDTADMHFYAGMGFALKVRLEVLRGENRAVAHAGVAARAEFLRALELDPQMPDATAGLGLYNYYVDSLSTAVKILRFFMGIPGGNKTEGIRQMQAGIDHGVVTPVEMRFHLARNLRTFDYQYERAIVVAQPLVERYPSNPIFQLLLANLNSEIGRPVKAAPYFQAALKIAGRPDPPDCCSACPSCPTCSARIQEIANSFFSSPR